MRTLANAVLMTLALSVGWPLAAEIITGRVTNNANQAEAGVWVIAESEELPTSYRKIVVTDDHGRFVLPELPLVGYRIWVRGYGLADSDAVDARPGSALELKVAVAADASEAAAVYPANYWLSLLESPGAESFADDAVYPSQSAWLGQLKLNCILCHQLGAAATRLAQTDAFDEGLKRAAGMNYFADTLGRERLLSALGDWGRRIATGDTPQPPPRPQGVERNVVITQWAWGDAYTYAHDEISTDKRNPHVNANGPVYGVDLANDYLLVVDPLTHTASRVKVPTQGGFSTAWCEQTYTNLAGGAPEPFGFGSLGCPWPGGSTPHQDKYNNPANPHNPMMDGQGRVWITTQFRRQWAEDLPGFCQDIAVVAENKHHRQLGYFDPARGEFTFIDTCFGTHHLQFDNNDVLWTSGDDVLIGWLDTQAYDPARPETLEHALGFSQVTVDSNGDGSADTALRGFQYGVIPNPRDGSVWSAVPPGLATPSGSAGRIYRYDPASDVHEVYVPPAPGMGPRGIDVDSAGNVWTALAGSGHLARFDRSKCKQRWGAGTQCAQGWTLWQTPGPRFAGVAAGQGDGGATDMHYYLWVDQFNTLGLGADIVIVNGTGSDSLIAFDPRTEQFTVIRIPYPLNTYTRGLDGRIDDPHAGWKGRGVWFTNGLDPIIHAEVQQSYVGKVQVRPHPLAH
jgi:streptogramin lyase